MKPTKMRNRQIHKATHAVHSRQVGGHLSKELRTKYKRRSVRVVPGDSVLVVRGVYVNVSGRIEKVFPKSGKIAVSGIKREKAKGGAKIDIPIHASNVVVTGLELGDRRRKAKIAGRSEEAARVEEPTGELDREQDADVVPAAAAAGIAHAGGAGEGDLEDSDYKKRDDREEPAGGSGSVTQETWAGGGALADADDEGAESGMRGDETKEDYDDEEGGGADYDEEDEQEEQAAGMTGSSPEDEAEPDAKPWWRKGQ